MTLRELIEHSHLAALGLLDPHDQALFERALEQAPRAVRDHLIAEQARVASSGVALPEVSPESALRTRVLDAVQGAMVEQEFAELSAQQPGEIFASAGSVRSGWRTASFALLTALLVTSGAFAYVYRTQVVTRASVADQNALNDVALAFGPNFQDYLFDGATQRTALTPASDELRGSVVLFTNADWSNARIFATGLPSLEDSGSAGAAYNVVAINDDGQVTEHLGTFQGSRQVTTIQVRALAKGERIAVVASSEGPALVGRSPRVLFSAVV